MITRSTYNASRIFCPVILLLLALWNHWKGWPSGTARTVTYAIIWLTVALQLVLKYLIPKETKGTEERRRSFFRGMCVCTAMLLGLWYIWTDGATWGAARKVTALCIFIGLVLIYGWSFRVKARPA